MEPAKHPRRVSGLSGETLGALGFALVLLASACSEPPPEGQAWKFPEYDLALRLPENWEVSDAYDIYAQQSRLPDSEVRTLSLTDVVRKTRFLLVAHPPPDDNPSKVCTLSIHAEDLSSYPNIHDVEAYAELAERAAKRHLQGYERLAKDVPVSLGHTSMLRREVRAMQPVGGAQRAVRSLTLFWKHGSLGFAIGAYELDEAFEERRADFEAILGSVSVGAGEPQGWFSRWLAGWRGGDD